MKKSVSSKEKTEKKTTKSKEDSTSKKLIALQEEFKELNDKHLRLYSEFDNYKKRTSKERIELYKTAGQEVISTVIPVIDDLERAMKSFDTTTDIKSVKDGINLVYQKFIKSMETQGLKPMESIGKEFNSDIHEAITEIPVKEKKQKGKVVDEIEKGYYLGEKLIRHAKVIVGA